MRRVLLVALILVGCELSDERAAHVLEEEGLHHPTYNGPSPFSCHEGDDFSESFVAYRTVVQQDGTTREVRVEGVICCGVFTCQVRQ